MSDFSNSVRNLEDRSKALGWFSYIKNVKYALRHLLIEIQHEIHPEFIDFCLVIMSGNDASDDGLDADRTESDLDPETDLLDRYSGMVETQVSTLDSIDDKAARTARLIGVLAGLIVTAFSVIGGTDIVTVDGLSLLDVSLLVIGNILLFVSLILSIIAYVSSEFVYGPPAWLGQVMSENTVDEQEYRNELLEGYSQAISINKSVIEANARWFKHSLTTLVPSLIVLFGAGLVFVSPDTRYMAHIVACFVLVAALFSGYYINAEEYLPDDAQLNNDE